MKEGKLKNLLRALKHGAINLSMCNIDKNSFGGKTNISAEDANRMIYDYLVSGEPLSVLRMGFVELDFFGEKEHTNLLPGVCHRGHLSKVMFTSKEDEEYYISLLEDAYKSADINTTWKSSRSEHLLLKKFSPSSAICDATIVEPYFFKNPWSSALEGKKVLVISPFTNTIESQYKKHDLIFENNVLPEFELSLVTSVWYHFSGKDERFNSWTEAFEYLKEKVDEVDFDVALLSCSSFGVPLCHYIKSIGKQAIYIGGALQIMFGIKGNRWDTDPEVNCFYNEHWVRLGEDNSAQVNKSSLDSGCYW